MWPKLLDLTQDECRGALRRLELESYSNVVGAFRAQGTLSAAKLRILKDLREAFHISDARHKAEVRRVVNDESLSTIAKMIYGPNSEIEWNKEGSRGFLIINRKPSQTALSAVADSASELGDNLNKHLKAPFKTNRCRALSVDNDATSSDKIVLTDPINNKSITKSKTEKPNPTAADSVELNRVETNSSAAKKKDSTKHVTIVEQPALKPSGTSGSDKKQCESPKIDHVQMPTPKPITANSRRRKSTTALANYCPPPKSILISNRRDTMIETSPKIRDHPPIDSMPTEQTKLLANEVRVIKKPADIRDEIASNITIKSQNPLQNLAKESEVQIIEAVVPHKVNTIKGTRNVMNAISQGAQLVKVIDSKIIKKPINLANMYAKPTQQIQQQQQKQQPLKTTTAATTTTTVKQTFTPVKDSNIEYVTVNDCARLSKPFKAHKIHVIASDTPFMLNNVVQKPPTTKNDIIPIPTARNPNIVKTSDRTIMHVSPHLPQKSLIKKTIIGNAQNHIKYPQKHVVQIMQPQNQPRMVTIHPNSAVLKVPAQVSTISEQQAEYVYEESNDWQNYDPTRIDNQNGYVKVVNTTRNILQSERDYQNHESNMITENIIYDDDIITEEYITSEEYAADGVIELEVDAPNYANSMSMVSRNVIGS